MKKLITTNEGGFPLVLDDLRWMTSGIYESLKAVCRALIPTGETGLILEGCELIDNGNNNYVLSEGYVYFKTSTYEEICRVDAQQLTLISPYTTPALMPYPITDSAGAKVFYNGTTYNTYQEIKGLLFGINASYTGEEPAFPISNIGTKISSLLSDVDWVQPII